MCDYFYVGFGVLVDLCCSLSSTTLVQWGEQTPSASSVGAQPATPECIADLFAALCLTVDCYSYLPAGQFQQLCDLLAEYHNVIAMSDEVTGWVPAEDGVFHRVPTPLTCNLSGLVVTS